MFLDGSIRSFGYSILLGMRTYSILASDSMFDEKVLEFVGYVFPSFVISQAFDFRIEVILCIGLVSFESSESFVFQFQEDDAAESSAIVDECDPVTISTHGGSFEWSM